MGLHKINTIAFVGLIILLSCTASIENCIKVTIPSNYDGWIILVPSVKKEEVKLVNGSHVIGSNGIGYIDSLTFYSSKKIEYYKLGRQLGESEVKFFMSEEVLSDSGTSSRTSLMMFYVLDKDELARDENYWDEGIRMKLRRELYARKDSFHRTGVLPSY